MLFRKKSYVRRSPHRSSAGPFFDAGLLSGAMPPKYVYVDDDETSNPLRTIALSAHAGSDEAKKSTQSAAVTITDRDS